MIKSRATSWLLILALAAPLAAVTVNDLPLVEVKPKQWVGDTFVVLVTGDGGWARFDRALTSYWADRGIGSAVLDAGKYFWNKRQPDEAGAALRMILEHYLAAWKKSSVILVGYSRGASVLPFMAARIPAEQLANVRLIALLGPFCDEDFEIHLANLLGIETHKGALPVLPEMEKLREKKVLCVCGDEEKVSLCHILRLPNARCVSLPGGHHFNYAYERVAALILQESLGPAR
jgi:type IV secretory pathway VirJ component